MPRAHIIVQREKLKREKKIFIREWKTLQKLKLSNERHERKLRGEKCEIEWIKYVLKINF